MKALVLKPIGRGFDLENVDLATPVGREVLVDVQASGLCHTDLLFATHAFVPTPAVLGYEVAGIVSAVGPDLAQICVGDHVVGSPAQSCGGRAPLCLAGRPFQCRYPRSTVRRPAEPARLSHNGIGLFQGFGLGGFAETALIHENQLAVVPKDIPFAQAALLGCGVAMGAGSVLNTRQCPRRRRDCDLWGGPCRSQCCERRAHRRRISDRRRRHPDRSARRSTAVRRNRHHRLYQGRSR